MANQTTPPTVMPASVFMNFDNDFDKKMTSFFDYECAQCIPKFINGTMVMSKENEQYNKFVLGCKNTPIPSFCDMPTEDFNENFRLTIGSSDYALKVILNKKEK